MSIVLKSYLQTLSTTIPLDQYDIIVQIQPKSFNNLTKPIKIQSRSGKE
jgi:hypothetical protein